MCVQDAQAQCLSTAWSNPWAESDPPQESGPKQNPALVAGQKRPLLWDPASHVRVCPPGAAACVRPSSLVPVHGHSGVQVTTAGALPTARVSLPGTSLWPTQQSQALYHLSAPQNELLYEHVCLHLNFLYGNKRPREEVRVASRRKGNHCGVPGSQ